MTTISYETNCGQYVMHRDGRPVLRPLDEVGLAVGGDGEGGLILYKHGDPELVNKWLVNAKEKFSSMGALGETMAADLRFVQGKFDLRDLNEAVGGNANALSRLAGDLNTIDVEAVVIERAGSELG
ncbi:MAG: hypothetical protein EPN79_11410 [Burkholderiaceae bacterium]|nr:MAG: hypothetical protein EPN79_11410 [Burkholderiaceae bacterium]TBR76708.1 MAG: hypothetical protein EPN64_05660 [Burkholderiaceae bacterium]